MELKPGYKMTEVGVIPEDWEVKRLGEVAEIISGGTPKTNEPSYWDGNIRWCTPTDITSSYGKYLLETERTISQSGLKNSGARLLPAGALLLCSRATIGELMIAGEEVCTNQGFKSLVCIPGISNEFLYYKLLTMKQQMIERAFGSTFLEISKANVAALEISLPPLPEQRAIAEALSDTDNLIEALDRLIAKKRDLKQAAMQELLTGKTRLPGFGGEWEVKRLGEVALLKNGYAFQSSMYTNTGNYKIATIANVQDGFMTLDECSRIDSLPLDIQFHQRLCRDDILISMTGNVGRVCRVNDDNCLLNQRVGKLLPTEVNDNFLFALVSQRKFLTSMRIKAKGGAQGNLANSDITEFEVAIPSDREEQTAIAEVLSDMDGEIAALEARRDKTRALKQGMMAELLTGKTRLL